MNDESKLHKALQDLVPDPPATPLRAAAARNRAQVARRRRRTVVASAVAVAVIAVAAPLGLTTFTGDDSGPTPPPTADRSGETPAAPDELTCPAVRTDGAPAVDLTGPDELPEGAIAVRLCFPAGFISTQAPIDALTTGVAKVVGSVNALPVEPTPNGCPADGGRTWQLVFQYPDGGTQAVEGASHGCGGVSVGTVIRGSRATAERPLNRFISLLLAQRASGSPATPPTVDLTCQGGPDDPDAGLSALPLRTPIDFDHAVLCWSFAIESDQPTLQAAIDPADLAVLLADLNANTTTTSTVPTDRACAPTVPNFTILGVTSWGDRMALDGWCSEFNLYGRTPAYWKPGPESQRILDTIVAANPLQIQLPDGGTPPDQVVTRWADLVTAGDDRADEMWAGTPPAFSGRIEVRPEDRRRFAPIADTPAAAYEKVVEQMALLRQVPSDGGWSEYHEYRFVLVRNGSDEAWQILLAEDHGVVPTGR